MILCFALILCLGFSVDSAPAKNKLIFPKVPSAESLEFMKKFGYLDSFDGDAESIYTEEGISKAVRLLQEYGNIPQTGVIDNATITLMKSERCGVPDIVKNSTRTKRYVLAPTGWNKRHLSYFVANWSPYLGEGIVTKNIQNALDIWGKYGHLSFQRSGSPDADIIVAFGRGHHGDMFPFDGTGRILAHAFFPGEGIGGDIHFDDDENWADIRNNIGTEAGTDFFTVALHELGHSLGLQHSTHPNSIMFAYYKGFDPNKANPLDYDDILGMYEMYIRRPIDDSDPFAETTPEIPTTRTYRPQPPRRYPTTPRARPPTRDTEPTTPRTRKTEPTTPRIRETEPTTPRTRDTEPTTPRYYPTSTWWYYPTFPRFYPRTTTRYPYYFPTSTTESEKNTTILYEGDVEDVDVHKNHDDKHNIPGSSSPSMPNICDGFFDAVATLRDQIFVFKDMYVWRLETIGRVVPGYPVPLSQMFPNLPSDIKKIDAAYERPDGMIILFTGNMYWVLDGTNILEDSPRPITDYGLPATLDGIDAVQNWGRNGKTYFYKVDRFWRYNEDTRTMDPNYPQHMEKWRKVPFNLDAATTYRGETYFFRGEVFYKFDNDWVITTDESPFPIGEVWMGCPEEPEKMLRLFGS